AVNGYVREAMSKEDATNLRSLSGMANNLNQLAHEVHVHHFSLVEKRILELAGKIDDVLIRLGNS
ncbi:MAG: plasmid mobilization relaxosome protein MobC, partial [Prevotellaceae bacterium]|nr:plasmid mobilization relaxosome protein MobC [Prevotellaceae bacterium]